VSVGKSASRIERYFGEKREGARTYVPFAGVLTDIEKRGERAGGVYA